jgi:guanylate kinase
MKSNWRRIIIAGKGGSGKDYLVKLLREKELIYSVSHTSRPPREGEFNGVDYYFVTYEQALNMANAGDFYEYVEFNGWFYGTSLDEFYRANLFIMTPSGIAKLKPEDREKSLIIFIDIDEDILRERLALRNDSDKAERRINADREDFKNFSDFDCIITNQNFTLDEVLEKIGIKND